MTGTSRPQGQAPAAAPEPRRTAQQINLLELALRPRRQWLKGRDMLIAAALLAAAVLGHYQFERQALARVLAAAVASAPLPADVLTADESAEGTELQQRQSRLQRDELLLASVSALTDLPRDSAQRLKSVIALLPRNVWLKEVEFRPAAGMRIAGGALDAAGLAEFARRLGDESAFKGLPLHVFAVDPLAAEADSAVATGAASARPAVPAHYGFVLSSVEATGQTATAAAAAALSLPAGAAVPVPVPKGTP